MWEYITQVNKTQIMMEQEMLAILHQPMVLVEHIYEHVTVERLHLFMILHVVKTIHGHVNEVMDEQQIIVRSQTHVLE